MSTDERRAPGDMPSVRIIKGAPTEEDLAAIAGVLPAAYLEEMQDATADEPTARSAWNRSRRMRRMPGTSWGRFTG